MKDLLQTVLDVEGEAETEEAYYTSMQRMINSGSWSFQGSTGRAMMRAIEEGYCMLGTRHAHDYWGNYIPNRFEIEAGTKGSREFVIENFGEEWAAMLDENATDA